MNKKVRDMVKNVIEENAVEFKKNTANAIYEKLNYRLGKEYVKVSKNFLTIKEATEGMVARNVPETNTSDSANMAAGGGAGGAPKPPSGTPGKPPKTPAQRPANVPGNPDSEKPDTTIEEWLRNNPMPNPADYADENLWREDLKKWYEQKEALEKKWYDYKHRFHKTYPPYRGIPWGTWYAKNYERLQQWGRNRTSPRPKTGN